jgi:hypothetical protein
LAYLWRIPQYRGRVQRRVLIAAVEDNLSVGVIERVAVWYSGPSRAVFDAAAQEIYRICATRNWWAQPDGHAYIFAWRDAERDPAPKPGAFLPERLIRDVAARDVRAALQTFSAIYGAGRRVNPREISELLTYIASRSGSEQATRLAGIYQSNGSAFGMDANLSGQALFAALVGQFGDQAIPDGPMNEVDGFLQVARERLEKPLQVENWALDGIHTGRRKDSRFAGVTRMMAACCRAFAHYGRLIPEDRWLSGFWEDRNG